jgi:hypothetical protein
MKKIVSCAAKRMSGLAGSMGIGERETWSVVDRRAGCHTAYRTVQLGRFVVYTVDSISHC